MPLCLVHISKEYFVSPIGSNDKKLPPNKQTRNQRMVKDRAKNGQEEPGGSEVEPLKGRLKFQRL